MNVRIGAPSGSPNVATTKNRAQWQLFNYNYGLEKSPQLQKQLYVKDDCENLPKVVANSYWSVDF